MNTNAEEIMAGYYEKLAEVYNDVPAGCFCNDEPAGACKHDAYWKGAVSLAPLSPCGRPSDKPDGNTAMYACHDCANLYLLFVTRQPTASVARAAG